MHGDSKLIHKPNYDTLPALTGQVGGETGRSGEGRSGEGGRQQDNKEIMRNS